MPSYLEYEVALLLAKYGKTAVLNALAAKMQFSHEELEALLKEIPSRKPRERASKLPSASAAVDEIIRQHPSKAPLLRKLHDRFQNRSFLPEFRDVRRFLEQHTGGSVRLGRGRSRPGRYSICWPTLTCRSWKHSVTLNRMASFPRWE